MRGIVRMRMLAWLEVHAATRAEVEGAQSAEVGAAGRWGRMGRAERTASSRAPSPAETPHSARSTTRGNASCQRRSAFFFQAEDGIRDLTVTGVQTCALPI